MTPGGVGAALFSAAAAAFRHLPHGRGKWQVADVLHRLLLPLRGDASPLCSVRMKEGSVLTWDVRDAAEGRAIWLGVWDDAMRDALLARLPSNAVVLDVGANVGAWTAPIARRLRAGGRVFAFEPVPENRRRLEGTILANRLENVVVLACALGDAEHPVGMWLRSSVTGAQSGTAAIVPAGDAAHVTVPMRTLDGWAAEAGLSRLDFIKLDVDGSELMVLAGAASSISRFRPLVLAEFDEYWMSTHHQTPADATRWAETHRYRLLAWDRSRHAFVPVREPSGDATLLVPEENA
jgi:FkbM family methyltransferase